VDLANGVQAWLLLGSLATHGSGAATNSKQSHSEAIIYKMTQEQKAVHLMH
jgi:hypothetical protein